jgi:hypothetical protein
MTTTIPGVLCVSVSPWARARVVAIGALAFGLGFALAGGLDRRDWNHSCQWTKITTYEDVANGLRTVVQEQSGSTEGRTTPGPNNPGVGIFGSGDTDESR